ncbi:hypothetical protein MDA_GLEAN10000555 [Myotis davidii]|uniref:Uncharacterized protein n=1 Tax=Myotis davidii TaxID=225400 RepID=L5LK33_MYODS|nr:hypothetical protein MDA_GLEAN10000555 [Myotis davidii]
MVNGGWQMEDGRRRMANGGRQTADGGWPTVDGGWRPCADPGGIVQDAVQGGRAFLLTVLRWPDICFTTITIPSCRSHFQ